jgi:sodium/bile acid cotransporter 7
VILGLFFPEAGLALPRYHVIDVGVVVVMFLGGLKLSRAAFVSTFSRWPLLLCSPFLVFLLSPVLGLLLGEFLGLGSPEDRLAVLLCSAQASTLATAIVMTEVARGDVALAMVLTVINNALSVLATPLLFRLFCRADITVDQVAMTMELLGKIVLPVLLAQVARQWLAGFALRHGKRMSLASQLIILIYVYAGVSAGQQRLASSPGVVVSVLVLCAGLHGLLLFSSAILSRLATSSPGSRVAFVLCSSQKTLPAAMLLWKSHFPALPLGPVVAVAYHMLQLVIDSLLAPSLMRLPLIAAARSGAKASNSLETKRIS